jgi:hypothetical protein
LHQLTQLSTIGSFDDFESVAAAFEGVYGAWINTDGFTVGEIKEIVRSPSLPIFQAHREICSTRVFEFSK